ncbi:MAG: SsrA-binding protein SmpB [Alphaproteobacteria bacterium]|nr:SsrA-binding protein SmpB [Alphaproteobacteria bacterium]
MSRAGEAAAGIAAQNRRARHDFFIESTIEAGIMLTGTEVKSLRLGRASIQEAFAAEKGGELYLINAYIPEYEASRWNHETRRPRKLLLRRRELDKLLGAVKRDGIAIVPLDIHFNPRGFAKISLGLAKGKRKADKRAAERDKVWKRDKARLMRARG